MFSAIERIEHCPKLRQIVIPLKIKNGEIKTAGSMSGWSIMIRLIP